MSENRPVPVRREWPSLSAWWAEMVERPAALREENERLRSALEAIRQEAGRAWIARSSEIFGDIITMAEAALLSDPGGEKGA